MTLSEKTLWLKIQRLEKLWKKHDEMFAEMHQMYNGKIDEKDPKYKVISKFCDKLNKEFEELNRLKKLYHEKFVEPRKARKNRKNSETMQTADDH